MLTVYDIFAMFAITAWFVLAIANVYGAERVHYVPKLHVRDSAEMDAKLNIIDLNGN